MHFMAGATCVVEHLRRGITIGRLSRLVIAMIRSRDLSAWVNNAMLESRAKNVELGPSKSFVRYQRECKVFSNDR